jgi:DNA-binding NarL/FixJ family response regulator
LPDWRDREKQKSNQEDKLIQVAKVRVVVVQGYCLLRSALVERLEREPWIEVCCVAANVDEARELMKEHDPQVLIINISLKCSVGISLIKNLKRDFAGVAVVAMSCDSEFENTLVGQALRAGADGYVSAEDSLDDLVRAVRSANEESCFVSQHARSASKRDQSAFVPLSRQETGVFCLTGCGYETKRIAERMGVKVKTIESYKERIRKKLGFAKGADLVYASTTLMRTAARRGPEERQQIEVVKEFLSTKG